MEASSEVEREGQALEDRLDDAETIGKARRIYLEINDLEKEEDEHKDRAKDARKRIEARLGLIRSLICDPKQLELPKAEEEPEPIEDPTVCPEHEDGAHEWERIRDTEGLIVENCSLCWLERIGREPGPGEPIVDWTYARPRAEGDAEKPAAEDAAVEEPVAS